MVRRVKAYLSQKRVIVSEDELMQLSQKIGEYMINLTKFLIMIHVATITGNGNAKLIAHETVSFVINPEFPFPVKRVHFFLKFHQNIRYFTILLFSTRT